MEESKVELIKEAIKQVIEEVGGPSESSSDDDDRHRLLSKLMSQLERLEDDPEEENDDDKILKELKEIRRQNLITHCLVSVMIVVTVVWQVSEVSIILKLKNGVTNPFRAIGGIFKSLIKPPKRTGNGAGTEEESSSSSLVTSNLIESSPVHDFKIPKLLNIDLPKVDFGFKGED